MKLKRNENLKKLKMSPEIWQHTFITHTAIFYYFNFMLYYFIHLILALHFYDFMIYTHLSDFNEFLDFVFYRIFSIFYRKIRQKQTILIVLGE